MRDGDPMFFTVGVFKKRHPVTYLCGSLLHESASRHVWHAINPCSVCMK